MLKVDFQDPVFKDWLKRLDSLDMKDVCSSYGIDVRGEDILCPEHGDRKMGSCKIYRNHYKCFSCGAWGGNVKLLQKSFHISFLESMEMLSKDFDIPIPEYCAETGCFVKPQVTPVQTETYGSMQYPETEKIPEPGDMFLRKPFPLYDDEVEFIGLKSSGKNIYGTSHISYEKPQDYDPSLIYDWDKEKEEPLYVTGEKEGYESIRKLWKEEPETCIWLMTNKVREKEGFLQRMFSGNFSDDAKRKFWKIKRIAEKLQIPVSSETSDTIRQFGVNSGKSFEIPAMLKLKIV